MCAFQVLKIRCDLFLERFKSAFDVDFYHSNSVYLRLDAKIHQDNMHNILLVEDEAVIRSSLRKFLEKHGYGVVEADSYEEAARRRLSEFSLIITDIRLPDRPGTEIISLAGRVPVLVMTSFASMRSAVDVMKLGAADYIAKPFNYEEILNLVKDQIKAKPAHLSRELISGMIGTCDSMKQLVDKITLVAPTDSPVLIQGESGTGKESVARAIHQLSSGSGKEMVTINCAATPDEELVEELFGFQPPTAEGTGRLGLLEAADGGTLYLDEITELPLPVQSRLLAVLQTGTLKRKGSTQKRKVGFRLLASTCRDIRRLVEQKRFREDLYYHINAIQFDLPPLRDRKDDLLPMAGVFLEQMAKKVNKDYLRFSEETTQLFMSYNWPGNIRELKNVVEGAVIMSDDGEIKPHHLPSDVREQERIPLNTEFAVDMSLEEYFLRFVADNQNHMTETQLARSLGISRKSLWEKRQKLNIPRVKSRKSE